MSGSAATRTTEQQLTATLEQKNNNSSNNKDGASFCVVSPSAHTADRWCDGCRLQRCGSLWSPHPLPPPSPPSPLLFFFFFFFFFFFSICFGFLLLLTPPFSRVLFPSSSFLLIFVSSSSYLRSRTMTVCGSDVKSCADPRCKNASIPLGCQVGTSSAVVYECT